MEFSQQNHWVLFIIIPLAIFDIALKTVGLWKSGRNNQLGWFICLAIFNTAGILPLVYLLFFQRSNNKK